jgi:hypothetical protein
MTETDSIDTLPAVVAESTPQAIMGRASDVAGVCKRIVAETAQSIQGRKYVRVEGWQAIATAHGCCASAGDVRRVETGYAATGQVRRMDTGAIIATAEGFVGDDEPMWAKRPEYARRAMAQTRAISRACRSAFAHVVILMNAGLETTPAEEMPHDESLPPVREMKRVAPAEPTEGVVEGTVSDVKSQRGKDGLLRVGVQIDGTLYGSSDLDICATMQKSKGKAVIVTWRQRGDKRDVVAFDLAPPRDQYPSSDDEPELLV